LLLRSDQDAEAVSKFHVAMNTKIDDHLQVIERTLNSTLSFSEELIEAEKRSAVIEESLNAAESKISELLSTLDNAKLRENEFQLQIAELEKCLTEAEEKQQTSSHECYMQEDLHALSELRLQLEATSTVLVESEEKMKGKESEIEHLNRTLLETSNDYQQVELRCKDLADENSNLRNEVKHVDLRVREELSRASLISREQNRAQFEQQLHKINREKATLEKYVEELKGQVEALNDSLVSVID
jgi:chromosome segregation ATPase